MNAKMGYGLVALSMLSLWLDVALAAAFFLVLAMMVWVADRQEVKRMKDEQ